MRDTYIMQDQSSEILKHNVVSLIALFDYPIYFKPREVFFRKLAWPISMRQSTYAEVVAQCLICFNLQLFFIFFFFFQIQRRDSDSYINCAYMHGLVRRLVCSNVQLLVSHYVLFDVSSIQ